jgi:transketolase
MTDAELDQLSVNTIRTLSIDAVGRAKSGPLKALQEKFGFEPERVVVAAREQLTQEEER